MAKRDIVVMGTSAGGMVALKHIVGQLPKELSAAVFIVWHISPASRSILSSELSRVGNLPATDAADGQEYEPGHIYVAPPDQHLLLEKNRIRLTRGPKENRFRPAIDPLFRSAALHFGPRVVGVVLTGSLDDGTAGLWAVKDRGGIAIVQDPGEAQYPSMPKSARQHVDVDYCVPLHEIAPLLSRLSKESAVSEALAPSNELGVETEVALAESPIRSGLMELGDLTPYTCPECHGALIQLRTGGTLRFRCHTGHAYSIQSLLADLSDSVENTLWSAVRAFEEGAFLMKHMSDHLKKMEKESAAGEFAGRAAEMLRRAEAIRKAAMRKVNLVEGD